MHYLTRRETFNAAHRLSIDDWSEERNREVFGKCSNKNWHGHNYPLFVTVCGEPDPTTGFVMDAKVLSTLMKERVTNIIDHSNLNVDTDWFEDLQPTTENLCTRIYEQLAEPIAATGARLYSIRLHETENIYAEYYGPAGRP
jgi:6-pyruvoyltetrahydropterin/6-carboxytetrahydropterin synthase